jgi:hypothetical protein
MCETVIDGRVLNRTSKNEGEMDLRESSFNTECVFLMLLRHCVTENFVTFEKRKRRQRIFHSYEPHS